MSRERTMAERGRRRTAAQIALVALGAVVGLLLAEIALRSLGIYGDRRGGNVGELQLAVDDPVLDYRLRPSSEWFSNGVRIATNSRGWRDREYALEKPPGTFRILALGDSVLAGHGVEMDRAWGKRFEELLAARAGGRRYEVVMLAIGALNTVQEAHLLEIEGLAYDPDLVLVGYVLNDPVTGTSLRRALEHRAAASPWERLKETLKRSSVIHTAYRGVESLGWRLGIRIGGSDTGEEWVREDFYTQSHSDPEGWAAAVAALDKIGALCRERGIRGALVIFPVLYDFEDYPWRHLHAQVAAAAGGAGLEVLDLLGAFEDSDSRALRLGWGDYTHPNPRGHRLAAQAVLAFLRERELLPPAG